MRHRILVLAAVVAAGLPPRPAGAQEAASAAGPAARTVAVVPFVNISAAPADDWIGAGFAETLAADLERLAAVSVVGRGGPRAETGAPAGGSPPGGAAGGPRAGRDVGRRRGADWLVTGGYQRLGEQVRVTARLVDAETGTVLAGAKADGAAGDVFAIQDRIGADLTRALAPLAAGGPPLARGRGAGAGAAEPRAPGHRPPLALAGGAGGGNGHLRGHGEGNGAGGGNGDGLFAPRRAPVAAAAPPPRPAPVETGRPGGQGQFAAAPPPRPRPAPVETDVNGTLALGGAPASAGFGVAEGLGILTGRPTMRPPRTRERPRVDGRLDDAVWQDALHITDFVQQNPVEGAPATEATDVWVAYDSQNFYLAVHAHYADPGLMRANRIDRDQAFEDDNVAM